jgi:BCD family chlorophyll transporter-like MFS transporter
MLWKRIQIGLIHVAVAMTLVPINSTLNRVMIKELAFSATLVALLASLPYLFSPIQVAIGSFSDRNPLWGYRRTPYILIGLLLCATGVIASPYTAYLMAENFWVGLALGVLVFGAWGMGFNFATVSYFSLASELSGERGRSKTISIMFFIMILGIIATSIGLGRLLEPYSPAALAAAFRSVALLALLLGLVGLIRLEPRSVAHRRLPATEQITEDGSRQSWRRLMAVVRENPQVTRFFWYLILMLAAILGQDVLLEPFAAEAFGMPVNVTTRITSLWGVCFLVSLLISGALEARIAKRTMVKIGAWGAVFAFLLIAASGLLANATIFYAGVVLLGIATGLATVSNLSLMLDMTVPGRVGLFIGVWGMANAVARLLGSVLSGLVRDSVDRLASSPVAGYVAVFFLLAGMLLASLALLQSIDVSAFRRQADSPTLVERAAAAQEI